MSPDEAWTAIEPLTKLGIALGEMDVEIDVPTNIDVLNIPAGKINLQRLFYWHVLKQCIGLIYPSKKCNISISIGTHPRTLTDTLLKKCETGVMSSDLSLKKSV